MSPSRRCLTAMLAIAILGWASSAAALTPEEEATSTRLMKEGIAAREAGDLEGAERAFRTAHGLANLPSSGMALARVLERRGKLLEALAVARAVQRMEPVSTWTSASTDAYRQVGGFVADLERRVGTLTIEIAGADDAAVRVELDGAPLKPPVLGVARQIAPGRHRIVVRREGYAPTEETIDVREGEARRFAPALVASPPGDTHAAEPPPAAPASEEPEYEVQPLLLGGFIALGVGVAAVGGGIVTGLMSQSQEDDLAPKCPNGTCPPSQYDALADAENLATAATILYIAGGVIAAGGATLIVIDLAGDDTETEEAATLRLRASPTALTLDGRF